MWAFPSLIIITLCFAYTFQIVRFLFEPARRPTFEPVVLGKHYPDFLPITDSHSNRIDLCC